MPLVIMVIVLMVIVGGFFYFVFSQQPKIEEDSMSMEGKVIEGYSGSLIAGNSSPLLDFQKEDYQKALVTDNLIVLYFYANWCPICKIETANALYPAFNELATDKVIGFRINYNDSQTDSDERDLARQFGIAYQHTKVFVKNGERVLKSPESWSKDRYLEEINKNLE